MRLWSEKTAPPKGTSVAGLRLGSRERHLLSETALIEEEFLPAFVRPMLIVILAATVAFLIWAGITRVKEVAVAPGEVIPTSKVKVVQHLDGGVVAEIKVDERMQVQEGQELLRVDGAQVQAELRQMESRKAALRLRAERLSAFSEGRKPNFAAVAGAHAELLADQKDIYRAQEAARSSTLSVLDRQIAQRTQRIEQLEKSLSAAEEHVRLTRELTDMREDLAARRLVNRTVLLETRRARVTAEGEVARIREEIAVSRQELGETRSRRVDTINQLQREAASEMGAVRAEMAEIDESVTRIQSKVDRLIVRAPHRGLIQDLRVQTVGQVIQPGALLMQIVPDDTPLEAEVRIAPRDIGHVRVGQNVNLRVSSYDYTRFGYARGTLKRVSATSVSDAQATQMHYRAWVSLNAPYVGEVPGQNLLQPGMNLEADIVTGEKSLLTYLIKPVADALSRSFHER